MAWIFRKRNLEEGKLKTFLLLIALLIGISGCAVSVDKISMQGVDCERTIVPGFLTTTVFAACYDKEGKLVHINSMSGTSIADIATGGATSASLLAGAGIISTAHVVTKSSVKVGLK